MRWDEIGEGVWNIPASRMKGKRPHDVPVIDPIWKAVPEGFRWENKVPIWAPLRPKGCPYVWYARDRKGCANIQWSGADGWCAKSPVNDWTPHDLRRSLATHWAEQLRADDDLIERQIAHKRRGVAGVYNRSTRLDERREMMIRWHELLVG